MDEWCDGKALDWMSELMAHERLLDRIHNQKRRETRPSARHGMMNKHTSTFLVLFLDRSLQTLVRIKLYKIAVPFCLPLPLWRIRVSLQRPEEFGCGALSSTMLEVKDCG